jgi:hypothetical protein
MKIKLKATLGALLASVAITGAAVVPASSTAGDVGIQAQPGQVCNLGPGWPGIEVWVTPTGGGVLYYMYSGQGFRILGYGANNTYYGRGNGQPEGYLWRDVINQSSCHW